MLIRYQILAAVTLSCVAIALVMGIGLRQQIDLQEETLSTTSTTLFLSTHLGRTQMKAASSPTSRNGIQTAFQTIILIVLVLAPI